MTQKSQRSASSDNSPAGLLPIALLIGAFYALGGAALLPAILGVFLVHEYAIGAITTLALLSIFLGFLVGCLAAIWSATKVSPGLELGGAALIAVLSGTACLAFLHAAFPNPALLLLGLYAAAAPAIIAGGRVGSRAAPAQAAVGAGLVCVAMMAGIAAMVLGVADVESARGAVIAASVLLLILGGFAAYRFRGPAPLAGSGRPV